MIGYGEVSLAHVSLMCSSTGQSFKHIYPLRTAVSAGIPMGEIELEISVSLFSLAVHVVDSLRTFRSTVHIDGRHCTRTFDSTDHQ